MNPYIALLRAVNLGGSTQLSMAALREGLRRRGYNRVETLQQSGNIVLRSAVTHPGRLERQLETDVATELGFNAEFFVRTAAEWRTSLISNPFPQEAERDPAHLVLTLLKDEPSPAQWKALAEGFPGRERVEPSGRQAYIVYPDGIGRSKLTTALIERKLGTRCTSRNWNTVKKLDRLASA